MPTYQYVCTECGSQLERVQKFSDEPLTVHDDCGGRLRKVYSAVGIVFKGSGFYRNDSRASGTPNGAPATPVPAAAKDGGPAKDGGSSSADSSSAGSSSASGGEKAAASPAGASAGGSSGEKVG